ncbi:MAG: replication initiator [Acidimicrobiales bacterium]
MRAAEISPELVPSVVEVLSDEEGYEVFRHRARSCRYCAEPVRLAGGARTVERATGEVVESFTSAALPGGELLKPCGTRRATRCPACAAVYQGDARALVRAGLVGGKGVESSVATRPMVFATLTGPSFGAVHRRPAGGGPCQARGPGRCPHGGKLSCLAHHREDDPALGQALCSSCYDFEGAVLWNARLSELWRRTVIYTSRELARLSGLPAKALQGQVRLSYVKVAELQRRGVVHLHVVARLDGADGTGPPEGFTAGLLALALRVAVSKVAVPGTDGYGEARWGEQVEVAPLDARSPERVRKVANYVSKYATKGSEGSGALDRRLRSLEQLERLDLSGHLRRMVEAAWRLGGKEALSALRLRAWAHTLGLRGHFLTKSRAYSTTFKALRGARQAHRRAEHLARAGIGVESAQDLVVVGQWAYLGRGWHGRGEALLAAQGAREAALARRFAYEEQLVARREVP